MGGGGGGGDWKRGCKRSQHQSATLLLCKALSYKSNAYLERKRFLVVAFECGLKVKVGAEL